MKKIAVLLALVLAMGLWGCQGGSEGTGEAEGTTGQEGSGPGQDTGGCGGRWRRGIGTAGDPGSLSEE